ncbi:MAG TPA: carbon-nitrogen hydrolase family protein [Gemmatimonadales bacterium]|jgi:predicted amidohydrolase|nr:carbon-nitrogen hydrolase family protein [Gemmatimonadales bacterium]
MSVPTRTIRVAAIQAAPALLDLEASLDRLDQWTRKAAGQGAKLAAFGETWLTGYPAWLDESPGAALWGHAGAKAVWERLFTSAVEVGGPATRRIAALAKELALAIVVGVHEREGRTLFNSQLIFAPDGTLAHRHRKLMPTYHERLIWGLGNGDDLKAVEVAGAQVGGLVCWEHWMPLARQAMHNAGEEIHVAGWPSVQDMHQVASRGYAFEGRCFVLAVGSLLRVRDLPAELPPRPEKSNPDDYLVRGGSVIIAPSGKLLAGPVFDEETVLVADCDLGEITRESLTLDVSGHYSRPDVFDFRVRSARGD